MFVYLVVLFIPIYLEYCQYKKSAHKILTFFLNFLTQTFHE
jgi:hypothetical protein